MTAPNLNITWCYPDILNLHGDRGNIMALEHVAKLMGVDAPVTRVNDLDDPIDFEAADILFFNVGEIKNAIAVGRALAPHADALAAYVNAGKVVFVVGTTVCAFAEQTTMLDGSVEAGLGLLKLSCTERELVFGDDLIFTAPDYGFDVNGSEISLVDTHLNPGTTPLGTVRYGRGNDGTKTEGARVKNLFFTNCLGPVLVKNPWLAEDLLREALKAKGEKLPERVDTKRYDLELKSMECIKRYNETKGER